jgi:hypothetical protein
MVEVFNFYATLFFYLAIGFPLVGGTLLYMGFQLAKVPDFTFVRCWKIYLAGLCYGYLAIMAIVLLLQQSMPVFQTVLFYAIPMVAIPILGRDYSKRTISVEMVTILVANSIMLALAFTAPYFLSAPSEKGRLTPVESTAPRQIKTDSKSEIQKSTNHRGTQGTEKKDTEKKDSEKN